MSKDIIWKISVLIILIASIVCFGLGLYFPILSTHTKFIFEFGYTKVNIFDSIKLFFDTGEYFVGAIILLFTFIFPALNYIVLFIQVIVGKVFSYLPDLNKWNMLDVFVVALVLLNFKMQSASKIMIMQLQDGTTYIALAVVLRMIAVVLMSRREIIQKGIKIIQTRINNK